MAFEQILTEEMLLMLITWVMIKPVGICDSGQKFIERNWFKMKWYKLKCCNGRYEEELAITKEFFFKVFLFHSHEQAIR
jgi:hypothetical protein